MELEVLDDNVNFFEWLTGFDAYVWRTTGRKVLLLLDNFVGHCSAHCLPNLESVDVLFLSANATSMHQPINAGSIACLKRRYHRMRYNGVQYFLKENVTRIHKIDQLTAHQSCKLWYLRAVWHDIPSKSISSFWKICGLLGSDNSFGTFVADIVQEEKENLQNTINGLVGNALRVLCESLLNADENDYLKDVPDEELVVAVVQDIQETNDNGYDEDTGQCCTC